jgi:hypothetical protein
MFKGRNNIERRAVLAVGLAGLLTLAKPAKAKEARETLILRTYANMTPDTATVYKEMLPVGAPITMRLNPERYAPHFVAIDIFAADGTHIGGLPCDKTECLVRLMQAGHNVTARVIPPGKRKWGNIDVGVFLVSA